MTMDHSIFVAQNPFFQRRVWLVMLPRSIAVFSWENARELREGIDDIHSVSQKGITLLGHSKAGTYAASALSMYWCDVNDKVAGLELAQSRYGGTLIASDILQLWQLGDYLNVWKVMEILICKVIRYEPWKHPMVVLKIVVGCFEYMEKLAWLYSHLYCCTCFFEVFINFLN